MELAFQESPACIPAYGSVRNSAVPCPHPYPETCAGSRRQERGQRDRSSPPALGSPIRDVSPLPRYFRALKPQGRTPAAPQLLPSAGGWGCGRGDTPNPCLQQGLREWQHWGLACPCPMPGGVWLTPNPPQSGGGAPEGPAGADRVAECSALPRAVLRDTAAAEETFWAGGSLHPGARWSHRAGTQGAGETSRLWGGSPSSGSCPAIPGGAGRQQPNHCVYFPPSKQHFDVSQQVSQTHVDRKCVQAREMLFICIKLPSDAGKWIRGSSVRGAGASATTAGSQGGTPWEGLCHWDCEGPEHPGFPSCRGTPEGWAGYWVMGCLLGVDVAQEL